MSASTNPVYVRLTRHAGWPSEPARLRIQIAAAGLLVALGAVALSYLLNTVLFLTVPLAFITAGTVLGALSPLAALIATAITMGSASSAEDLKLVMLSNLTPHDIVYGYYRAALHRLRLLWAIAVGLLPGIAVSVAYSSLMQASLAPDSGAQSAGRMGIAFLLGVVITAAGAGISAAACAVGAMVGVWLALEWRSQAPVIAVGMLAASALLCAALTTVIPCAGFILVPIGMWMMNHMAWRRAKRAVEARSTELSMEA